MNNMETAQEAFNHFVTAFERGLIKVSPCSLFDDVYVHIDMPDQTPRFTYIMFDPENTKKVIAQCVIMFAHNLSDGNKKWIIGWCTDSKHRNKGIGYDLSNKALQEFSYQLRNKLKGDYIEANVDTNNLASLRIAEKLIGNEEILIKANGEKAHSFLRQFS